MTESAAAPIGVFDSGIGGLTVVRALRDTLPNESIVYLGDTARVPYGSKSPDVVRRYARNCAQFLVDKGAKAVVIACNTATAHGLQEVRSALPIPVLGVIEPGARLAAASSHTRHIGVIGTEGTINSGSYQRALARLAPDARVSVAACPLFVPLAEEGLVHHAATRMLAEEYLAPLLADGIDTLVLGCTHYPLLAPLLQDICGPTVTVINSATVVAQELQQMLAHHDIQAAAPKDHVADKFYATDVSQRFARVGGAFLGDVIREVMWVDLTD